jgi:hypothetical protein
VWLRRRENSAKFAEASALALDDQANLGFTPRQHNPKCNTQRAATRSKMSLLRPSITGRLIRAGGSPSLRAIPSSKRFDSQTAIGTPLTTSDKAQPALTTVKSPNDGLSTDIQVRHNQPDYGAEIDSATSYVAGQISNRLI